MRRRAIVSADRCKLPNCKDSKNNLTGLQLHMHISSAPGQQLGKAANQILSLTPEGLHSAIGLALCVESAAGPQGRARADGNPES